MNEAKYREAERKVWQTVGLSPSEERIRLACTGTQIRVQLVGAGDPVVFLHGAPNAGTTWAPMLEHFRGYRCILVDRPGTGLSEDYAIRGNVLEVADRFVSDLLDGLGFDRVHVVASSFGGFLALRSAAARPERFGRMVQMACPAMAPGMRTPTFMRMARFRFVRWLVPRLPPAERATREVMRQIGHGASIDDGRIPRLFSDWYLELQRHTHTLKNDLAMIGDALSASGFDPALTLTRPVLRAVTAPTHFLWGADDGFGGAEVAHQVVSAMPHASFELIPRAGHLPWLDDPRLIAGKTAAFLAGN